MPVATPNPVLGLAAKLGIGDSPGPATVALDFVSETLGLQEEFADTAGLRGTRSHFASRVRAVRRRVTGGVNLRPTPVEFAAVMRYLAGGTPASGNYPLAETIPPMAVQLVRGASLFTYPTNLIDRATFQSTPGQILALNLELLGTDETVAAASGFPALSLDNATTPFVHADAVGAFTVGGITLNVFDVSVEISNGVQAREVNSLAPTVMYSTDRTVTWRFSTGFGDAETLYGLPAGGAAVTMTWTNGGTSLTLSSPKLQVPRKAPNVQNRDEIRLQFEGVARASAVNGDELSISVDASP